MIIEKGTVIKLNGIPFELKEDAFVVGDEDNLKLAADLGDNGDAPHGSCCENPQQEWLNQALY